MPIASDLYQRIVTAKLYIDDNFQEAIDLDKIAGQACLSRFHFHRLFTKVYKITPHQYLTRKRIDKAKTLLHKDNLSVTEVCGIPEGCIHSPLGAGGKKATFNNLHPGLRYSFV